MLEDIDFKKMKPFNETEMVCHQGFWYVATPFAKLAKKDAMNIAARAVFKLLKSGVYGMSPILHTSGLDHFSDHSNIDLMWIHTDFLRYDSTFMDASVGGIFVDVPESRESLGMYGEHCYFTNAHKPIYKITL